MKKPPFPTQEDLVQGWIALDYTKPETSEREESFWSFMLLDDLVEKFPKESLDTIKAILNVDDSDAIKASLSAGPMEDLLVRHGQTVIEQVEIEARRSGTFSHMLGGIWQRDMDNDVWLRLTQVWDRSGWDEQI